jgi:hypothetical protein
MTRSCCARCHLRFSRRTTEHLVACPFCAEPLDVLPAAATLGFKLIAMDALLAGDDPVEQQAIALSVALPVPHE